MTIATPHPEYLSARAQLIKEIAQIVKKDLESSIAGLNDELQEDVKEMIESDRLIAMLSDAVCKHFPSTPNKPMTYTYSFNVLIARQFKSDIADFDDAFDKWAESFRDSLSLRQALLDADESTKNLCQGIVWTGTETTPD